MLNEVHNFLLVSLCLFLLLKINISSVNDRRIPPYFYWPQPGSSMMQKRWLNHCRVQVKQHSILSGESYVKSPKELTTGMNNVHLVRSCSWSKWIGNEFCYLSLFCFGWSQWRYAVKMMSTGFGWFYHKYN